MPNWKKIITSGSNAALNSLTVATTLTANSIKTPTGTSTQFLMADGSVTTLTNPITGTGTTNYVSKFTGTNTLGNSQIFDNGVNVGIGTTSPAAKLDMTDALRIQSSTFSAPSSGMGLELRNVAGFGSILSYDRTNDLYKPLIFDGSDITIKSNGNNRIYLNSSGNVGIGTTSPNAKLDVNGNTTITGSLAVSQSLLQYSNITSVTSGSTSNVASFNTSSYTAAFFDYVTTSGTSARAGTVFTVWNGNNVEYTETSTNDIGNTNNLVLSASLSAGAIRLQATSLSGSWSVKTLARMI